jgi:hypothetical protein
MNLATRSGLGLAVVSSLLAAACGPTTVDVAGVEKNVRDTIDGPGSVKVDTVDCPEDQVATVGETFTCSYALTDGSSGEITVTVADEEGAGRWDVTRPAIGQAEQVVLTDYGPEIGRQPKSVRCPDPLKTGKKKKTTCVVRFPNGETRKVSVIVIGGDIWWQTK